MFALRNLAAAFGCPERIDDVLGVVDNGLGICASGPHQFDRVVRVPDGPGLLRRNDLRKNFPALVDLVLQIDDSGEIGVQKSWSDFIERRFGRIEIFVKLFHIIVDGQMLTNLYRRRLLAVQVKT